MLDLCFPAFCFGCGYVGAYVCRSCAEKQRRTDTACFYCGRPSPFGITHHACKRKEGIDGFVSLYQYGGVVKKAIHTIKYKKAQKVLKEPWATDGVGAVFTVWEKTFGKIKTCPVPLFLAKERRRGFNQAALFAQEMFRSALRRESPREALTRVKDTESQTKMKSKKERRRNVCGAFVSNQQVGGCVLLVDDVVTSGATVCEAAKTLKRSGGDRVLVLALAKG